MSEFKIGDKVRVTERYRPISGERREARVGKIGTITDIHDRVVTVYIDGGDSRGAYYADELEKVQHVVNPFKVGDRVIARGYEPKGVGTVEGVNGVVVRIRYGPGTTVNTGFDEVALVNDEPVVKKPVQYRVKFEFPGGQYVFHTEWFDRVTDSLKFTNDAGGRVKILSIENSNGEEV